MPPRKTPAPAPSPITPEEQLDFVKIVYKEIFENSRYYDGHVWQIPSVTVAVNGFLVGQAFAPELDPAPFVRMMVVFGASVFTFVLLLALVKHRLHKSGQDLNIEKIEKYFQLPDTLHQKYNFSDREQIKLVRPNLYERMLAPLSAGKWLMFVMALTVVTDIAILVGIGFGIW